MPAASNSFWRSSAATIFAMSAACSGPTKVTPTPVLPGPAGTADAVDVAVAVVRRIEVDDVRDPGDVDAAGGDVGRDQRVDMAGLERCQRPLALALGLVAVHRDGVDALGAQALDEPVGAALGAHEDERELAVAAQLAR